MQARTSLKNQTWWRTADWRWAALLLCWLALSLVAASLPFIPLPQVRRPGPPQFFARLFAVQLAGWLAWALVSKLVRPPVLVQLTFVADGE